MKAAAIIQARMGSTRLPGKVLLPLGGMPVLQWVVRAARSIHGIDEVVVATSTHAGDDPVAQWCEGFGVTVFRGSEADVLDRFLGAAQSVRADAVLRLTADCPFLDPFVCGQVVTLFRETGADYASNVEPPSWPDGLDCEMMSMAALSAAAAEARRPLEREHVTPFITANRLRFPNFNLTCAMPGMEKHRWTLDRVEDYRFLDRIAARLPKDRAPSHLEILALMRAEPELAVREEGGPRNEGAMTGRAREGVPHHYGYDQSRRMLEEALPLIPLASQTFSKSHTQLPYPDAPLFLTHGRGGISWDVDGNEYVDMIGGLLPNVLGYCDPDVDYAIRQQLGRGISFSLATRLEADLARRLTRLIPCADMVRFGKNGTDATSAAIRLARAYTGRDHVLACGYHGWQDWYIGATTRNKGVPGAVRELTHMVAYNDLDGLAKALAEHKGNVAAVIMEPMNVADPAPGYLEGVKRLAHEAGALLVFDEVITGFRFALGGAQSLFGVTPDLASFGKAMGNGMPISAVVGRAEVMREMEEIFFSGTFGGEALSLAAAIAVIDKMEREPVIETLSRYGAELSAKAEAVVAAHGLGEQLSFIGRPPWRLLKVGPHGESSAEAVKTFLLREMLRNGVLINSSHNVCYAHTGADAERVVAAYDNALAALKAELAKGRLDDRLPVPVIRPVFTVRKM